MWYLMSHKFQVVQASLTFCPDSPLALFSTSNHCNIRWKHALSLSLSLSLSLFASLPLSPLSPSPSLGLCFLLLLWSPPKMRFLFRLTRVARLVFSITTLKFSVLYCLIFGGLLQLAAAIDHAISKKANLFATEENEGIPLYDGKSLNLPLSPIYQGSATCCRDSLIN